jgi:hypothetical protein
MDKTSLSFWFPKLQAAGLPVPRTLRLVMPRECRDAMFGAMDGKEAGDVTQFRDAVAAAGDEVGWPCFLRTDHTSGKHQWKDTCFLPDKDSIMQHVWNIVEYSELADLMGLPWDAWAVRELLPTIPLGICRKYGDMPVCREFRFFVEDGNAQCAHPYWPRSSLDQGGWDGDDRRYRDLCSMPHEVGLLAARVSQAIEGAWSVDILETKRGWYVTDLAEAHKSYHWPECEHALGQREAG